MAARFKFEVSSQVCLTLEKKINRFRMSILVVLWSFHIEELGCLFIRLYVGITNSLWRL